MPIESDVERITGAFDCPFHVCYDKSKKWRCPFLIEDNTGCAWISKIKPYYEAKRLLKIAWSELDTITRLTDIEDEKNDTKS